MSINRTVTLYTTPCGLLHLQFQSSYLMGMTLFRVQEYCESCNPSVFRKSLNLEQSMDGYVDSNVENVWDYCDSTMGFNFTSNTLIEWVAKIPSLSEKERWLAWIAKPDLFRYIIATLKLGSEKGTSPHTLKHEIAHYLWYYNTSYKLDMQKLVYAIPYKNTICRLLEKYGMYNPYVCGDEIQAHFATESISYLKSDLFDLAPEKIARIQQPFQRVFNNYAPNVLKTLRKHDTVKNWGL